VLTPGNDYRLRFHGSGPEMARALIDLSYGHTVLTAFFSDATDTSGVLRIMEQDSGNQVPIDVTFDIHLPRPARSSSPERASCSAVGVVVVAETSDLTVRAAAAARALRTEKTDSEKRVATDSENRSLRSTRTLARLPNFPPGSCTITGMELRVSNRQAAASLDQLLDRVSGQGDTVIIERDGRAVGRLVSADAASVRPGGNGAGASFRELVEVLRSSPASDDGWADAVEEAARLGNRLPPTESPWDS